MLDHGAPKTFCSCYMKAIVINGFGGPEVFQSMEVETPVAKVGEVLIRVEASSVNPVDTKIRSGVLNVLTPPFPAILHGDVAGVVESVGEGVSGFHVGAIASVLGAPLSIGIGGLIILLNAFRLRRPLSTLNTTTSNPMVKDKEHGTPT